MLDYAIHLNDIVRGKVCDYNMQKLNVMAEYISFNLLRIPGQSVYKATHVSTCRTSRNVNKYLKSEENMKQYYYWRV